MALLEERMSCSKPRVIVAPHFRKMAEIFDQASLKQLAKHAEVVWGQDGPIPQSDFEREIEDASAIVFGTWSYGRDAIRRAGTKLRAVIEVAGGHSHRDFDYTTCLARGVALGTCAPAFGPVVAEMALALTLASTREIAAGDRAFREGTEQYLHDGNQSAITLYGKTVGFVGCGGLTRALLPLLKPFGPTLLGYDPWLADGELNSLRIEPVSLTDLFERSDIVYVMAVPSPENEGLISRDLMNSLSPTDVLVVASRAHLVDYESLRELVDAGQFKAAVDVYPDEPVSKNDRIRAVDGIVHSAHRGGAMPEALLQIGRFAVADLVAILDGRPERQLRYATADQLRGLGRL